jgi:glutaredoxin
VEVYLIYGITDCPACLRAQAELMDRDIQYVFIQTDFSKQYRKAITEEYQWPTFPIVIKSDQDGETLIGGYDQLWLYLETDDLNEEHRPKSTTSCAIKNN